MADTPDLLAALQESLERARTHRNGCADRGHPIADDDYVCGCGMVYTTDAP